MQLEVTKSNTLNAFSWIKNGWRLFTLQPSVFMGMSATILVLSVLGNMHQILGVLVLFMMPFLTAGYYQAASRIEGGESVTVGDIFHYFSQIASYRVFVRLAFLSIVMSIPTSHVLLGMQETMLDGGIVDFQTSISLVFLLAINFMLFAFAVPAAWVAPTTPVLTLIKQSFKACWINIFPLVIYGLLILLIAVISFPVIIIGWLIAYSVGVLSFYQMFLTLYRPVSSGDDSDTADGQEVKVQEVESEQVSEQVSETDRKDN